MLRVEMEDLLKRVDSRYKLVIVASTRTLELNDGKAKLVDMPPTAKLATIALREIAEGKITYKVNVPQEE